MKGIHYIGPQQYRIKKTREERDQEPAVDLCFEDGEHDELVPSEAILHLS